MKPARRRWRFEAMEPRELHAADALAAALAEPGLTFTVTSLADDGAGSLREALALAAAHPGLDRIVFDLAGPLQDGAHTVALRSALPAIADPVQIDASTEPDARALGRPVVVLAGDEAGRGADGLVFADGSDGSTVRGLAIGGFEGRGLVLGPGADGVTVEGVRMGTDAAGLVAHGNRVAGLAIEGSAGHRIAGSLIAGNGVGVAVAGAGVADVRLTGNLIGTDATGTSALGNRLAGLVIEAPGVTVGGAGPGAGNLISGNGYEGVMVLAGGQGTVIQGNRIGTDLSGLRALGNGSHGIYVQHATEVRIGGTAPGEGNLVAWHRDGAGIAIVGEAAAVSVLGNAIHDNGGLGIDLGAEGPSGYREADADGGPNHLLNHPLLTRAASDATSVHLAGTVETAPGTVLRIEFFASEAADPSGYGEGARPIGSARVTTGADGRAGFDVRLAGVALPAGTAVSATATVERPGLGWGDSSEFGTAATVQHLPSPPQVRPGQTLVVAENGPAGTPVGRLLADDPDAGDPAPAGWRLEGGDFAGAFALDPLTGALQVTDARVLDHEGVGQVVLQVSVGDGAGGPRSAAQAVTVVIADVNEPPVLSAPTPWRLAPGVPLTLDALALDVADPDADAGGGSLVIEVGRAEGGWFESVLAPGVARASFSVAELAQGTIRFVAEAGGDGSPQVLLRASDGQAAGAWIEVRVAREAAPPPAPPPGPEPEPMAPDAVLVPPQVRLAPDAAAGADAGRSGAVPMADARAATDVRALEAERWLDGVRARASAEVADLQARADREGRGPAGGRPAAGVEPMPAFGFAVLPPADPAEVLAQMAATLDASDDPALRGGRPAEARADPFDGLRETLHDEARRRLAALDPVEASGLALSVAVAWWAVRLGGVAGSLLASVPTWRFVDPLPVLERAPVAGGPAAAADDAQSRGEEAAAAEVLARETAPPPAAEETVDETAEEPGPGRRRW